MVVRFEVDACLPSEGEAYLHHSKTATNIAPGHANTPAVSSTITVTKFGLTITRGAMRALDPEATIEIKTTGQTGRSFDWKEFYPQLYLSGTRHHIFAKHKDGVFTTIQKRDMLTCVDDIQRSRMGENLGKLAATLISIKKLVRRYGKDGRISLIFDGKTRSTIKVYERVRRDSCLPEELLRRFK